MIIDNNLTFDANTDMLCKKGQQRLYCLRKFAKFTIDKNLMKLFYSAYMCILLFPSSLSVSMVISSVLIYRME